MRMLLVRKGLQQRLLLASASSCAASVSTTTTSVSICHGSRACARFFSTAIKPTASTDDVENNATATAATPTTTSATTAATTTIKPGTSVPRDWKGSLPLLEGMPLFLPYMENEAGGMRTEDFMYDYYHKFGGRENGITAFGRPGNQSFTFLVYDEGFLQLHKEGTAKYPSGILEGAWPIQQYNDKHVNGVQNPFTQNGEAWRMGRMAINPYIFNKQTSLTYLDAINESSTFAAQHFEQYATAGKLDRFCELAAFDMFVAAALGLQMKSVGGDNERGQYYAKEIIGSMTIMGDICTKCPYSKLDAFKFRAWDDFVKTWGNGRQAAKELMDLALEGGGEGGSGTGIMHGFVQGDHHKTKISSEEATEMFLTLMFAAADTTSSLINNVLTNLSRHPDVQEKVRAEMQQELGGSDYTGIEKFHYFEQVLKESQRLTPPLPWVNIKSNIQHDNLVINGYRIPKGCNVGFSHVGIATDERLAGPKPHQFDPERFSTKAIASRKGNPKTEFLDHPVACKPFGFGARMCIGSRIAKLEYTSLISRIVQDYQFQYDNINSHPNPIRLSKATTIEYPPPIFKVTKLNK